MKKLRAVLVGSLVTLAAFVGYNMTTGDSLLALNPNARDCDSQAIIYCGAITPAELAQKYAENKTGDLGAVFDSYGISSSMISSQSGKMGHVTKNGDVVYEGEVVATGAMTLGRKWHSFSTPVTIAGKTFYAESPRDSFVTDAIAAHIYFDDNGQFVAAILASCANPIRATAVPVPPKPPAPTYTCDSLAATKLSRTEYQFTTTASAANGANITGYVYDFGDGQTANGGATIKHAYAAPGTYNVTVKVKIYVNGQTVEAPGNCVVQVVVPPEPCPVPGKEHLPKDSPDCFEEKPSIDVNKTVNNVEHAVVSVNGEFEYQIAVKNTGNIVLKDAVVTDKAPKGVTFVAASQGVITNNEWKYTIAELKVGETNTYTIKAKVPVYQAGTIKNTVCVDAPKVPGSPDDCDDATIEVPKIIEVCDLTTKQIIKIDEKEYDKSKHTTDLDRCKEVPVTPVTPTPQTPTHLPETGAADVFAGSLGLGSIAGATYYYAASRRSLMDALLQR